MGNGNRWQLLMPRTCVLKAFTCKTRSCFDSMIIQCFGALMIPLTPLPTPEHYSIFFIIVLDNSGCRFLNFSLDYCVQLVTFFLTWMHGISLFGYYFLLLDGYLDNIAGRVWFYCCSPSFTCTFATSFWPYVWLARIWHHVTIFA
jgi:hypothetical protein